MKRYSDETILQAQELRRQNHYSFAQLQKITDIPATTIRNWCKNDILGTRWDTLLATNERKRQEIILSEQSTLDEIKDITPAQAKVYAALLYWCEGAKYPSSNKMDFTNSDPRLMQLFIFLLRRAFPLDESKFSLRLQLHTTHTFTVARSYWCNLLSIPESQAMKPTITHPRGGKHRSNYRGTCTLRYSDFRLQLKLIAISEIVTEGLIHLT
jgi:hypothetical protein